VSLPEWDARTPMDHIRKIVQLSGNPVWQVNGRKFGFGRPQFATKELAEAELADMIKKRGGGLSPGRRDVTFAEQAEAFLVNAADGLAEKTLRSYRGHLNVHILPHFGKRRVVEINAPMIKTFLTEKRQPIPTVKIVSAKRKKPRVIDLANFDSATMKRWAEQDADATRKLSISTLRLIRATLSVVFASAVDDRIIDRNPVPDAKVSRHSRKAKAANRVAVAKERVFTEAQQAALLSWCSERDPDLHDLVFLLLRSGLRPGECRALAWDDIDFTRRKIRIEYSASDKGTFGPTKTGLGRSVDISPALRDVMRLRMLKRSTRTHMDRGEGGVELVFSNPSGTPLDDSRLRKRFDRAMEETKITGHVLYDARHTYASTLLARCRDFVYVAAQLGHASPKTTMDHYAHLLPGVDQNYADLLDESEADWQRFGSRSNKQRIEIEKPIESA
jgi:integrase